MGSSQSKFQCSGKFYYTLFFADFTGDFYAKSPAEYYDAARIFSRDLYQFTDQHNLQMPCTKWLALKQTMNLLPNEK